VLSGPSVVPAPVLVPVSATVVDEVARCDVRATPGHVGGRWRRSAPRNAGGQRGGQRAATWRQRGRRRRRRGGPHGGARAGAAAAGGGRRRRHELGCLARRGSVAPRRDFAELRELECLPPRAPRRDSGACSPEIGLRRGNSSVRAMGGGRPISRTMGHMTGRPTGPTNGHIGGPTTGPTGARTTGRASGPTTGTKGGRTTVPHRGRPSVGPHRRTGSRISAWPHHRVARTAAPLRAERGRGRDSLHSAMPYGPYPLSRSRAITPV